MDFKAIVDNLTKQREGVINDARACNDKLQSYNSQISELNGALALATTVQKQAEAEVISATEPKLTVVRDTVEATAEVVEPTV